MERAWIKCCLNMEAHEWNGGKNIQSGKPTWDFDFCHLLSNLISNRFLASLSFIPLLCNM